MSQLSTPCASILAVLACLVFTLACSSAFSPPASFVVVRGRISSSPSCMRTTSTSVYATSHDSNNGGTASAFAPDATTHSRRTALNTIALTPLLHANQAWAKGIKPDAAFNGILKAKEELITATQTYMSKRDYEGLQSYLTDEATNMNNYEANAKALLESKQLDAESKKAIGTIRTYGVGADVIIMYGGLKSELDMSDGEPNPAEIQKYMKRTMDALDEIIVICRGNGF